MRPSSPENTLHLQFPQAFRPASVPTSGLAGGPAAVTGRPALSACQGAPPVALTVANHRPASRYLLSGTKVASKNCRSVCVSSHNEGHAEGAQVGADGVS
jgi:hypothetical protein